MKREVGERCLVCEKWVEGIGWKTLSEISSYWYWYLWDGRIKMYLTKRSVTQDCNFLGYNGGVCEDIHSLASTKDRNFKTICKSIDI